MKKKSFSVDIAFHEQILHNYDCMRQSCFDNLVHYSKIVNELSKQLHIYEECISYHKHLIESFKLNAKLTKSKKGD